MKKINHGLNLTLLGGVALLVIGNSPATLLPFIVGTLEDGFNLDKQTTGSIVSTELIAMSLSAIFLVPWQVKLIFVYLLFLVPPL